MGRFHRHDGSEHHHHHHDDHHHVGHHHDHDHSHLHDHDHEHVVRSGDLATADVGDHSGYATGRERIMVLEDIFAENDNRAAANRAAFDAHEVVAINVMSSPGAGKTTLLEKTLAHFADTYRLGVIEGDIETALDAERLRDLGAQVSLLNTGQGFGGECHLDAPMVSAALQQLELADVDAVFIENVGNLVCPAEFDVGAHHKIMVASVTEGEDKPLKYPVMFRSVSVVVINKVDLLPYLDFDMDAFRANIAQVNPEALVVLVSTKTGDGLADWYEWVAGVIGA